MPSKGLMKSNKGLKMQKKEIENKLEDLLGRYWNLAYNEGKFSQFQSCQSNLVLLEIRDLFKLAIENNFRQDENA